MCTRGVISANEPEEWKRNKKTREKVVENAISTLSRKYAHIYIYLFVVNTFFNSILKTSSSS